MLLRDAYSAKYRAAHQKHVENLRDGERDEFNVKLEKTKELSRDTNRRRRALEQRRKDYEAEEEKQRREILAQRKKEIQEATEKFQRSNIVRTKRKISNHNIDQKLYQKVKDNTTPAASVAKYTPTSQVNGQPYYPSVEEVLAMLQSDRAQVIDRLATADNQHQETWKETDLVSPKPSPIPEPRDTDDHVTAERHALDQERLRSEVVGRSQPRLAFGDQAEETTGVLPTTIRRDSPSGSLSSVDSLDEVPDELAKPVEYAGGVQVVSAAPGIIRNPKKPKHGNQVSFNENVVFSDGLTGVLKTKDDITGMGKQASYFEMPSKNGMQHKLNESAAVQQSSIKTSEIPSSIPVPYSFAKSQSTPQITPATTTVNKYPYVTVTHTKCGEIPDGVLSACSAPTNYTNTPTNVDKNYYYTTVPSYNGVVPSYPNATPGYPSAGVNHTGSISTSSNAPQSYPATGTILSSTNVSPSYSGISYSGNVPSYSGVVPSHSNVTPSFHNSTPYYASAGTQYIGSNVAQPYPNMETSYSGVAPSYPGVAAGYANVPGYSSLGNATYVSQSRGDNAGNAIRTTSQPSVGGDVNMVYGSTVNRQHVEYNNGLEREDDRKSLYNASDGYNANQIRDDVNGRSLPRGTTQIKSGNYVDQSRGTEECNNAGPFSSINILKLRDSLEMSHENILNHNNMINTSEESLAQRGPDKDATEDTNTQDVAPDTPLVPVTKEDFLSKALSRTTDHTPATPSKLDHSDSNSERQARSDNMDRPAGNSNKPRPATARHISKNEVDSPPREFTGGITDRRGHTGRVYKYGVDCKTGEDATVDSRRTGTLNNMVNGHESKGTNGVLPGDGNLGTRDDEDSRVSYGNNRGNPGQIRGTGSILGKSGVVIISTKNESVSKGKSVSNKGRSNGVTNGKKEVTSQNGYSDELLKSVQADIERITMLPTQPSNLPSSKQSSVTSTPSGNTVKRRSPSASATTTTTRKTHVRKNSANGAKTREVKRVNSSSKRLHRPRGDSATAGRRPANTSTINIQYTTNQNPSIITQEQTTNTLSNGGKQPGRDTNAPDTESRPITTEPSREPTWASTFERKQYKNKDMVNILDKTPTDEEINKLWETVRTCLKHEPSHKAASDSIVNTIRRSRSESGPVIGNHYLIDNQRYPRGPGRPIINAFGPNTPETRTTAGYVPFRRQNSLDGLERGGSSESSMLMPQRKGSLLGQRSSRSERKLTRTQSSRPPVSPQYIQTLRGPASSARGPQKSNSIKPEESKLSYAEFQTIMQASTDVQTRNGESETGQKRPQQTIHQPIIMDYRKEPSALSVEEKRLLESLDRLNERLKVQEAATGKLIGHRNSNTPTAVNPSKLLHQTSPNNARFTNRSRHKDLTSPSLLNRR